MIRRLWRSDRDPGDDAHAGARRTPTGPEQPFIRDAERRSLWRLLRRRDDLLFDLQRSEDAFLPENSWTERIGQLDAALAQAADDLKTLDAPPPVTSRVSLPATPIEVTDVHLEEPASITLRAGSATITYREEIDWAERGHTVALPELDRVEGDVVSLIPADLAPGQRDALITHLRDSFAIIADEALDRTDARQELTNRTLADITQPCQRCGGWLDPKGRCPSCAERDRLRQRLLNDTERLRAERESIRLEMVRARERLPIVRRQLAETEAGIERLRAKGVEPESP